MVMGLEFLSGREPIHHIIIIIIILVVIIKRYIFFFLFNIYTLEKWKCYIGIHFNVNEDFKNISVCDF